LLLILRKVTNNCFLLQLISICLGGLLFATSAVASLNYETYRGTGNYPTFPGNGGTLYYSTPLSTGTVSSIDHHWSSGNVLDSGRYDDVIVHYSGYITVPSTGTQNIKFYLYADDGVYMKINDTLVINDWNLQAAYTWNYISASQILIGGDTYSIDAWMYERGGGAAFRLYWDQGGSISIVPASAYTNTAPVVISATPVYNNYAPTQVQQDYRNNALAEHSGTGADVSITGNSNFVNIQQAGAHIAEATVLGSGNNLTILQTGSVGVRHFASGYISGNNNVLAITQQDSSKAVDSQIYGDDNQVDIIQKGTGSHFLELEVTGNDNQVDVLQDGAGSHEARVELENNGGAWDFTLNQSGKTNQYYNLPHGMSDGTSVSGVCNVAAGCNLIVNQN
jgi:hypothetical protein